MASYMRLSNWKYQKCKNSRRRILYWCHRSGRYRDLVGESKTGSGKTHTFLLPIFQKIDTDLDEVQAVITAPSRELATQIYKAAQEFTKVNDKLRVSNFVGGTDKARQIKKLESSQPHVVIGTPGRIHDLIKSNALRPTSYSSW